MRLPRGDLDLPTVVSSEPFPLVLYLFLFLGSTASSLNHTKSAMFASCQRVVLFFLLLLCRIARRAGRKILSFRK